MTESERKKMYYWLEDCNVPYVMKKAELVYNAVNFRKINYFGEQRNISREEALIIAFYLYEQE